MNATHTYWQEWTAADGTRYRYTDLAGFLAAERPTDLGPLPCSLRVLLESVLRRASLPRAAQRKPRQWHTLQRGAAQMPSRARRSRERPPSWWPACEPTMQGVVGARSLFSFLALIQH